MFKEPTLILRKGDLIERSHDKTIDEVEFTDFMCSYVQIAEEKIILYIDENGNTRILKNQYGNLT